MKLLKEIILACVLAPGLSAACVPASEPLPPAGAGGLQTDPTPAASGEPFMTRDGWRVTIDKLILRAGPKVQSQVPDRFGYTGYSTYTPTIFNAKDRGLQIYTPEIPPGPASVGVTFNQYSIYIGAGFGPHDDYAEVMGSVDAADAARFLQVGDQGFDADDQSARYGYISGQGPCVLIELHASKDGVREVKLKAALGVVTSSAVFAGGDKTNDTDSDTGEEKRSDRAPPPPNRTSGGISIEIRANALALARLEIAPEKVFTIAGADGIDIGRLFNADANKDGEVTGAELATVELTKGEVSTSVGGRNPTLLDLFAEKLAKHLLTARAL